LVLTNNLSAEVSNRIADVDAEESRAQSAEASLAANLSTEISRAQSAETSLNTKVDFVISNTDPAALDSLTEIVGAFQSADSDLNGAITSLATAATTNLSTEVSRAQSVEAVLSSDLSAEVSNRIADVDAEESRAMSAELVLTNDLSAEVSRAESVETSLDARVSAEGSAIVARFNVTPVVSSFLIGDGAATVYTCNHNLGTTDVIIQVYDVETGETVETGQIRVGTTSVQIDFADAPGVNAYKVVTMGIQGFQF